MTARRTESRPPPPLEEELKFACSSLEDLRERLRELSAERITAASAEDNWVYDRNGELRSTERLLRLRIDRSGSRLTFKGPPRFEDEVKVRVEHETGIHDADQIHGILESLGYEVSHRYQKKREEWQLGGVTVALDHTPIGDFVEFEGPGATTVARRCGFAAAESERRTYIELYESYRERNPEAPPEMVFS